MSGLKETRDRIKSVRSTKKMTQAMRMVSASKFRRLEVQARRAQVYSDGIDLLLRHLIGELDSGFSSPLLHRLPDREGPVLCVVITSTRGLCGSLNSGVIKKACAFMAQARERGQDFRITCVGKKGLEYFSRHYKSLLDASFDLSQGVLSLDQVKPLSDYVLTSVRRGVYSEVCVFYTAFRSVLTQEAAMGRVVPLGEMVGVGPRNPMEYPMTWEPNPETVASYLLPHIVESRLFSFALSSAASEQGARMLAMDGATKNAEEMIKRLTVAYNRKRQGNITKELVEIISGCEALA